MRNQNRYALYALIFLISFCCDSAKATDALRLEIDGVRLYMSSDQVITALNSRFGNSGTTTVHKSSMIFLPGEQMVSDIKYDIKDYEIDVRFTGHFPANKTQHKVSTYIHLLFKSSDFDDEKAFRNSVEEKYSKRDFKDAGAPCWGDESSYYEYLPSRPRSSLHAARC
jgi:hypothetical protein